MRVTVFGASGGTGRELVRQAVAAGHTVTAVVRATSKATVPATGYQEFRADVMDPQAITPAVRDSDVVLSALGMRSGAKEPVLGPAAESIVAAMHATGARRLVVVTASGHIDDESDGFLLGSIGKPITRLILRRPFADMSRAETVITGSGLDWTLVRPPRLTDAGHKPYRTVVDRTVGLTISRADLAAATLLAAADPATIGHALGVGY